ncbi:1638_t:CDS:2 [Acaulospora colombiana]|uniref:1638_t:CDS:1 n=1 Tax=Acaulospora colombiana TaxID=27376 RepID=A0ACA9L1K4_9GLOM|nr:1638_t:CDS:2 [Acaulospora colombiana]
MIVDVAILATTFPHKRKLHFWAKNSLFANKYTRPVLVSGGVVPVDRTTKNNQLLFDATFEAALEYSARLSKQELIGEEEDARKKKGISRPVIVLPCGITYVQKSKYRSTVMIVYGPPIRMEPYDKDFEKDNRATVKRLTKDIESAMEKLTVNAPDWKTYNAATMTRLLLFSDDKNISLDDFVQVTQSLINFYANSNSEEKIATSKTLLDKYKTSLDMLQLSDADVARYDKHGISKLRALCTFLYESLKFFIQLPFFLPALFFHWPIYVLGKVSVKFEKYEESMAQNKIMLGLVWLMISYTILFFMVWTMLFYTPLGLVLAAGAVFIFAWYHVALVDRQVKKLASAL